MAAKKNSYGVIAALIIIIIAAIIAVIVLDNNNKGLSSAQQSSDKAQITKNWQTFFSYTTPQSQRIALLQDGTKFTSIINSEFQALGTAKSSVKVNSINLTNSMQAKVNYGVYLNNALVLPSQNGTALLENNSWVVSDSTFCGLISEAEATPAVCQNL